MTKMCGSSKEVGDKQGYCLGDICATVKPVAKLVYVLYGTVLHKTVGIVC